MQSDSCHSLHIKASHTSLMYWWYWK